MKGTLSFPRLWAAWTAPRANVRGMPANCLIDLPESRQVAVEAPLRLKLGEAIPEREREARLGRADFLQPPKRRLCDRDLDVVEHLVVVAGQTTSSQMQ